jgi:[acyl-carrier-protein] S-malonyltransferase
VDPGLAFLFPGQGAQFRGMAVDLAEQCPEAREVFERGREVLGVDLLRVSREGPDEELNSTRLSQPAIFLHSMAVLEVLARRRGSAQSFGQGLDAQATAGLSLGEYSALVFAGALRFEDALEIVARRGEYMQEACDACPGAMASVLGLSTERVEDVVAEAQGRGLSVGIANYNSPSQTVISGEAAAVQEASQRLTEAGARRIVPLKVAGAYHSPLMAAATAKLAPLLDAVVIRPPRLPFFANVSGERADDPETVRRGLKLQVESAVRWEQSLRGMLAAGVSSALELGPGTVLAGLMRTVDRSVVVESVGDPEALDKLKVLPV